MTKIADNIKAVQDSLPAGVNLVAVSKFHPVEELREAYDAGQRFFGESRAQELEGKVKVLPADIRWHFIGHLQTNKVKMVVPVATMIESIDSEYLLKVVDAEAAKIGKVADVLLELHVAKEETKTGLTPEECITLVESGVFDTLKHVRLRGVMGMASNTDDAAVVRDDFRRIRATFDTLKAGMMQGKAHFDVVSMGMSHDYRIAVEEGSTMVRVGTRIFGAREY